MSSDTCSFPHPWPEVVLGSIASVTVGGTPSTSIPRFWNGEIPWMASGDVHRRRITDVPGRISESGLRASNAVLVEPRTVAVALAGQGKTRGTVGLVETTLCTNQSVALVKSLTEELDEGYLFHNLSFRYEELRSRSAGGGRAGLTKGLMELVPIPLPTVREQLEIAQVLDKIDRAIAETTALIVKQRHIKTGLMQDLLTRGIDEDGNIRSENTHAFKDSPLGRIPVDWELLHLEGVLLSAPRNGYSPTESASWQGCYLLSLGCLSAEGFVPNPLKYAPPLDRQSRSALLCDGDFLISRSNTRSSVGIAGRYRDIGEPCIYPDLMMRLRFSDSVDPAFMEYLFRGEKVRRQIENAAVGTSGSMLKINAASVKSIAFPSPPKSEQLRITETLNAHNRSHSQLKSATRKLTAAKSALMQDLLTGKVRVTPLLQQPGAALSVAERDQAAS